MKRIRLTAFVVLTLFACIPFAAAQTAPATIKWFVDGTWYKPVAQSKDSVVTSFVLSETNVNVAASNPSEDKGEKLNLMLAAGDDLPDLITEPDQIRWSRLVQSGALLDLTPYLSKLTNLSETVPPTMVKLLRESDGKLYGLPSIFATEVTRGYRALMYNQTYYDQLGKPKVDTWADFEKALASVKALKSPQGESIIPLSFGGQNGLVGSNLPANVSAGYGVPVVALSGNGLIAYTKDGPVSFVGTEAFKKTVLLLNRWFNAGYIDREAFIQSNEQFMAKVVSNRVAFTLDSYWGMDFYGTGKDGDSSNRQISKEKNAWWGMRPPVDASFKGTYKNWDTAPSAAWHLGVSAKTKNLDAVLRYLNWCLSARGQFILWTGYDPAGKFTEMEGKFFTKVPGTNVLKPNAEAVKAESEKLGGNEKYQAKYGVFWNNPLLAQDIEAQTTFLGDRGQLDAMTKEWVWDGVLYANIDVDAGTPELAMFQKIRTLANSETTKAILQKSPAEAEKIINALQKSVKDAGIDKVEKVWKAKYAANQVKLK